MYPFFVFKRINKDEDVNLSEAPSSSFVVTERLDERCITAAFPFLSRS